MGEVTGTAGQPSLLGWKPNAWQATATTVTPGGVGAVCVRAVVPGELTGR